MSYSLWASYTQQSIEIEEAEFERLAQARSTLNDALAFEQKYELVLQNWLDLERAAARWSMENTARFDRSYGYMASVFAEANKLVMNLLTAGRAYADQVGRDFKATGPSFKAHASEELRQSFEASHAYRFMSELRDHVQHHALPVRRVAFEENMGSIDPWRQRARIFAAKEMLALDKDFKLRVLEEQDADIDLLEAARGYVEGLSRAHHALRRGVSEQVDAARDLFVHAIARFGSQPKPGPAYALKSTDPAARVLLHLEWDEIRLDLARRNHKLRLRRPAVDGAAPGAPESAPRPAQQ